MPHDRQNQSSQQKDDKGKADIKDGKRLRTLEEGDDPNEVAPSGVGEDTKGSSDRTGSA